MEKSTPWNKYFWFSLLGIGALLGLTFLTSDHASAQSPDQCYTEEMVSNDISQVGEVKYKLVGEQAEAFKAALISLGIVPAETVMVFDTIEIWNPKDPRGDKYLIVIYAEGCMLTYFADDKNVVDLVMAEAQQHMAAE